MSRKEAVLPVSRAVSVLQMIYALTEVTYLPVRLMSFSHHVSRASVLDSPLASDAFYRAYYGVDIAFLLVRVAIAVSLAVIFWNCGPWIERILLPRQEEPGQTA